MRRRRRSCCPYTVHGVLAVKARAFGACGVAVFDPVDSLRCAVLGPVAPRSRSQEAVKPPLLLSGVAAHP